MPVTHVVFINSAAVGCVPLSASLLSPWLPVEDLKPWIKLEKSSLGLGGQGKEEQSLHFLFHPKPQEVGGRLESGIKVLISHGNVVLLVHQQHCLPVDSVSGDHGRVWRGIGFALPFFFLLSLLHDVISNYTCHSQNVFLL